MKLTKFEHSCMDITEGTDRLIIDPGIFSPSLTDFANITALVVTHFHPDHLDKEKVAKITKQNPQVKIFTTQEVADEIKNPNVTVPETNKTYTAGAFTLEFFGKDHAVIMESYPLAQNLGVLVNNKLYHPGDSFTACPKPHTVLSVPVMAPWLKFSEVAEFATQSSATKLIPTHNGFINADGQGLYDRLLGGVATETSKEYAYLAPGDSLDI